MFKKLFTEIRVFRNEEMRKVEVLGVKVMRDYVGKVECRGRQDRVRWIRGS